MRGFVSPCPGRSVTGIKALLLAALLCAPLTTVRAVEPSEILADPALESRARDLSKGLRCLVCRNQSIDESDADLARDLRVVVRERLVAGDSNDEVLDYVVDRFGEYVLLKPRFSPVSAALWLGGPLLLLGGCLVAWRQVTRRDAAAQTPASPLTEAERARLRDLGVDPDSRGEA